MEKYIKEKLQAEISGEILYAVKDAVQAKDWDETKKLLKLYNSLDRGW